MTFTNEQLIKAKSAKTAEELLALAKASGIELTEEQAKTYFAELNKTGELSDDELTSVAGGDKGEETPPPPAPTEYFYQDFVGKGAASSWAPICPNELGFRTCGECEGNDYEYKNGNSYYCCNGHHKRK